MTTISVVIETPAAHREEINVGFSTLERYVDTLAGALKPTPSLTTPTPSSPRQ